MAKSKQQIIAGIIAHMENRRGRFDEWYVGVSRDAGRKLFSWHSVHKVGDDWIFLTATSAQAARQIRDHMQSKLDMQGDADEPESGAVMVYAFRMTSRTRPGLPREPQCLEHSRHKAHTSRDRDNHS